MTQHLGKRSEEIQEAHRFRVRLVRRQDFSEVLLPALDEVLDLLVTQRHVLSVAVVGGLTQRAELPCGARALRMRDDPDLIVP